MATDSSSLTHPAPGRQNLSTMAAVKEHPPGQGFAFHAGVLTSAAALSGMVFVLVRLWSPVLGEPFPWIAQSLPLAGAALGGMAVASVRSLVRQPRAFSRLAILTGLTSPLFVVAMIQTLREKPVDKLDRESIVRLLLLSLFSLLPFITQGAVFAGALRQSRGRVGTVFASQSAGMALGWLLTAPCVDWLGAPRAGLLVSIALGLGSVLFALTSLFRSGAYSPAEIRGGGWAAAAFFLSSLSLMAGDYGERWLSVPSIRFINIERAHWSQWGPDGLLTVDRPTRGTAWLRFEASAIAAITDGKTAAGKHPDELALVVARERGRALILGAGGGRELRMALAYPGTQIVAVEPRRALVQEVMRGKLAEFSGGLYDTPGLAVVVDDLRDFLRSGDERFGVIMLALNDSKAASPVLGMMPPEAALYTVDGFEGTLERLADRGLWMVSRPDADFGELLAVSAAALARLGAQDPALHLFACSHGGTSSLLLGRSALELADVATARAFCRRNRFVELIAPDRPAREPFASVLRDPWHAVTVSGQARVPLPTADRPFFGRTLSPARFAGLRADRERLRAAATVAVPLLLAGLGLPLLLFVIGVPPIVRRRDLLRSNGQRQRFATLLFGIVSGAGIVFAQVATTHHASLLLGGGGAGQRFAVCLLLAGMGLGALAVHKSSLASARDRARSVGLSLSVMLVLFALALPGFLEGTAGRGGVVGLLLALVIELGLGALLGALAALGYLVAVSRSRSLVTWMFSASAAAGLLAASTGLLVAMSIGYSFLLLLASALFFIAILLLPEAERGTRLVVAPGSAPSA